MKKLQYCIYRIILLFVKLFYPPVKVAGMENLPEEPCVIVSNHCKLNGPISLTLYFPGPHYLWCTGERMKRKEEPEHAQALPRHKVVPYLNYSRKKYGYNISGGEAAHEETRC